MANILRALLSFLFLFSHTIAGNIDAEFIAIHNQALEMLDGEQNAEQTAKALDMLRESAQAGLRPSKIKLAELLYLGVDGVEKNLPAALPYIRKLALSGHPWSQNTFAVMHEHGLEMPVNRAAAAHWYREAALQGHARAMSNLGILLRSGPPQSQNPVEAIAWLKIAAEHDDTPATNILEDIATTISDRQKEAIEKRSSEIRKILADLKPL